MQYKQLTGTDLSVSALCLGGASFCDLSRREEAFRLFDRFFDAGGNFIDTANVYGRWNPDGLNSSEQLIGEWMASRGNRGKMIVTTKGAHPPLQGPMIGRLSRDEITADLESSLTTLGVDCIDLYYLHRDNESLPVEEIAETMNRFIKAGMIRYFGVSNWTPARMEALNAYAEQEGLSPIAANQPMWSLASVNFANFADKTLVPLDDDMYFMHLRTGMAAVPYSSQASGFFTKLAACPETFGQMPNYQQEENRKKLARVQELAAAYGMNINQIVLQYLLSQPFPVVPIVGCRTEAQLADSLSALEQPSLSPEDLLYLGLSAE